MNYGGHEALRRNMAWPLVCLQYPTVADALADIDWLRQQLAA